MRLIDFRDLLYEVTAYAALPQGSRAHRKAFDRLRRQILLAHNAPRSIWTRIQIAAIIVGLLWFAAMAVCALFRISLEKWILLIWLGVLLGLSALLILTEVKARQFVDRWIHQGLDEIVRRLSVLSPAEFDTVEALLWNEPAYIHAHPIVSPAVCGCIRCGELFAARDILRDSQPPRFVPLAAHPVNISSIRTKTQM